MTPRSSSKRPSDSSPSDRSLSAVECESAIRVEGGTALAITLDGEQELFDAYQASTRKPVLVLLKGADMGRIFVLNEGPNMIGRPDSRPVHIDLEPFEAADRIWSSRQHAVIRRDSEKVVLEDLNSLNGTFVNRTRVHPKHPRPLQIDDIIQIGTVQLKLIFI